MPLGLVTGRRLQLDKAKQTASTNQKPRSGHRAKITTADVGLQKYKEGIEVEPQDGGRAQYHPDQIMSNLDKMNHLIHQMTNRNKDYEMTFQMLESSTENGSQTFREMQELEYQRQIYDLNRIREGTPEQNGLDKGNQIDNDKMDEESNIELTSN